MSMRAVLPLAGLACLLCGTVQAATLKVGPNQQYREPGQAIAAARDGDTVSIAPGTYFDCAVVHGNRLTIEGAGPGVVMTDKMCEGKAILVTAGNDIAVRNLTLQRARVPDENGAGIRAEGTNLTIDKVRFFNNENGILTGPNPASTITISDSEFADNGKCIHNCAHAIYVGGIKLLRVVHSYLHDTHVGHQIKSRALRTEVIDCRIVDGQTGTSSYLIDIPNGGTLIAERNVMEKGAKTQNQDNAIMIGEEGVTQPTGALLIQDNTFTNDQDRSTIFVHNITATPAQLVGNVFKGHPLKPLEGDGSVR